MECLCEELCKVSEVVARRSVWEVGRTVLDVVRDVVEELLRRSSCFEDGLSRVEAERCGRLLLALLEATRSTLAAL